ncbi:ATPase-AAA-core domain-containing protein [Mycena kentingensis (nom. inval.)]|nr:ATPase-AAA-core domain-containing protein [Mycena kentingensis (nom. inval.)]
MIISCFSMSPNLRSDVLATTESKKHEISFSARSLIPHLTALGRASRSSYTRTSAKVTPQMYPSTPPSLAKAPTRLDDVAGKLRAVVETIQVLSDGTEAPFLEAVCLAVNPVLGAVQNIKNNRNNCINLLERVRAVLCAIVAIPLTPEFASFHPDHLAEMGRVIKVLRMVFTLLESQKETSRIKRFFKQGEDTAMFKACYADLEDILRALEVENMGLPDAIREVEDDLGAAHERILDMIRAASEDGSRSTSALPSSAVSSASVFSFIPPNPKIFHGRDVELIHILDTFAMNPNASIVILGPGGIGKTSLAQAVLHHPDIAATFRPECCVFAGCDTALNAEDILHLVATQLGLDRSRNPRGDILSYMTNKAATPHLIVLDNLETIWEPPEFRHDVEDILSFLAGFENAALLVTVRGAERPAGVPWTRPFLPPLEPLGHEAARETFMDIADEPDVPETEIHTILALTDNIPLAITLVASLVGSEGAAAVISRWNEEKTGLLSDITVTDKRNNLDISIAISLTSPRMQSNPAAHELLRILSVLPDGLAQGDLKAHIIPVKNPLACQTTLLRTSLAYMSPANRLTLLVPIREFMRAHHPPPLNLIRPLFRSYRELLELFDRRHRQGPAGSLRTLIRSSFANIQSLLELQIRGPISSSDAAEVVPCGILASLYNRMEGRVQTVFMTTAMERAGEIFRDGDGNAHLEVSLIAELLRMHHDTRIANGGELIERAISLFRRFDDNNIKCQLYLGASFFAELSQGSVHAAGSWADKAIAFSEPRSLMRATALSRRAGVYIDGGEFASAAEMAETALAGCRENADMPGEAATLAVLATAKCELGLYGESLRAATRGREILSYCEFPGSFYDFMLLNCLAEVHRLKSEYREAQALNEEVLQLNPTTQPAPRSLVALLNLVEIESALDLSESAQARLDIARQSIAALGWEGGIIMRDATEGVLLLYQRKYPQARVLLTRSFHLGGPEAEKFCLAHLADPNLWSTHFSPKWAYVLFARVCRNSKGLEQKYLLYKALQFLGGAMLLGGEQASARNLLSVALEGLTMLDIHRSVAECLVALAEISGDARSALDLLNSARARFERSGMMSRVKEVEDGIREFGRFEPAIS